ncbi:Uncharacterized protein DBV05_g10658 [Lasiodiplodia theobromae]|uniref:Capsule synthesis protein CapA domain-containing protein n=1 Tax=Lasiodiplodia theobromae TaxID=45133 RepID=A0A5N5CZ80_9PEZI|nr:Uncharacterized protein DBV05_g10658 [Lasiodiplodia theobromae]
MSPKPLHLTAAMAVLAAQHASSQTFTLAASGDFIGELVPTNNTRVHAVWDLFRSADFGFFNMEGSLFTSNMSTSPDGITTIYPASENGKSNTYGDVGGGPYYDPSQAALLAAAGFTLASHANNHAFDYAEAGMFATQHALSAANVTFAGSGASLQEARKPAVRQSADGSTRLALVAAAGTHTLQSVAGAGDDGFRPRPGISALRASVVTVVDAAGFAAIKAVARAQGQAVLGDDDSTADIVLYTGQYPYAWSTWRLASDEQPVGLAWAVNEDDYVGILDSVRAARDEADAVVFSLHAHESFAGVDDSANPLPLEATVPAAYTQNISRAAVAAGAEVVLVHGPHHLRGVEVYAGKPIFYGLGSLTYSLGLHYGGYDLPIEWDDGVVAVTRFEDGVLAGVELHPLVHGQLTNDTESGESALPKIAPPAQAVRILEHLKTVSEPFGTTIAVREGVGYVELGL